MMCHAVAASPAQPSPRARFRPRTPGPGVGMERATRPASPRPALYLIGDHIPDPHAEDHP